MERAWFDIASSGYRRNMATISFDRVGVEIDGRQILEDVTLDIPDGALMAVIGPSGAGKSSMLRLVSGLLGPTSGSVTIDGVQVDQQAPWTNRVAMVFQDDALYEHMTVGGNLEFPWRVQGHDRATATEEAKSAAARVGVRRFWSRFPRTLSGGQRGQVATARALSRSDPSVVLLDEPLAQADAGIRRRFRAEIRRLHEESGLTMLFATNDQSEAMSVSTHLAVLMDGRIRQVGAPMEVYDHPADADVAAFVGSPPMNLMPAKAIRRDGVLEIGGDRVQLDFPAAVPSRVLVGCYPSELRLAAPGTSFDRTIHVTIGRVEDLGSGTRAYFGLGRHPGVGFSISLSPDVGLEAGDRVELTWVEASLRLFDAASGEAIPM
jgi:ABC-type sugar transport system ATPase subunit